LAASGLVRASSVLSRRYLPARRLRSALTRLRSLGSDQSLWTSFQECSSFVLVGEIITINRGERCRAYLTVRQVNPCLGIGGACRLLWNLAPEQRATFSRRGRSIG
jgi:hypothetical protein